MTTAPKTKTAAPKVPAAPSPKTAAPAVEVEIPDTASGNPVPAPRAELPTADVEAGGLTFPARVI